MDGEFEIHEGQFEQYLKADRARCHNDMLDVTYTTTPGSPEMFQCHVFDWKSPEEPAKTAEVTLRVLSM